MDLMSTGGPDRSAGPPIILVLALANVVGVTGAALVTWFLIIG